MCCSIIRAIIKDKLGRSFDGFYQKASGYAYWNQMNNSNMNYGDYDGALWYDIVINVWYFGSSSDLESNIGEIHLAQHSACPVSDNQFKYFDDDKHRLAPIKSVSIQCI